MRLLSRIIVSLPTENETCNFYKTVQFDKVKIPADTRLYLQLLENGDKQVRARSMDAKATQPEAQLFVSCDADADLVICLFSLMDQGVEDNVNDLAYRVMQSILYIRDYAKRAGKPYIISMSLNRPYGNAGKTQAFLPYDLSGGQHRGYMGRRPNRREYPAYSSSGSWKSLLLFEPLMRMRRPCGWCSRIAAFTSSTSLNLR